MIRAWAAAFAAIGFYLLAGWSLGGGTGLVRTVVANTPAQDTINVRRVDAIDLDGVDAAAGGAAGVTVMWRGVWELPESGLYDLALAGPGRSSWSIDGHPAPAAVAHPGGALTTRTVWLTSGFREIDVTCAADAGTAYFAAVAARTGSLLAPLDPRALKPRLPRNPRLRAAGLVLRTWLGWLAIAAFAWAIRKTVPSARDRWRGPHWRPWMGRTLAWSALACLLIHGAFLRLDAITGRYGPVTSPRWLAALQTRETLRPQAIRSDWIVWTPEPLYPHPDTRPAHYRGDPYTYLLAARQMPSFYAAHYREPVFPFATKVSLWLLGDQDVAVSFASAFFSLLAIGFTYVLGAALWSRPAGVLAALGLSIDYDVISSATLGWRDDAYVAAVALCAYLMVRCWRTGQAPVQVRRLGPWRIDGAYVDAVWLGVAAGLAMLTRFMAVPFLIAGALFLLAGMRTTWRRRWIMAGVSVLTAAIVAGPYFLNCWRVYGDPLYTFNVHGRIYSMAEGRDWTEGTVSYVGRKIAQRPFEMIDTVAQGLTTYPFEKKWSGLSRWGAGIGEWASMAALAGLIVLAAFAEGRLVLIAMVASLVPFAVTWKVDPNFRFTEHVYPVLLIAAAVAIGAGFRVVRALLAPRHGGAEPVRWGTSWRAWASVVGVGLAALWFVTRVSPPWVFAETLRAGEDAAVTAGTRDRAFFGQGWSDVIRQGNVSTRVTRSEGSLSIRLPEVADYPATLRMDPFPRPLDDAPPRLPALEVWLNGSSLGVIPMRWTPDRVGAYDLVLPRAAVRRGRNDLLLRVQRPSTSAPAAVQPGLTDGDAVGVWYVRVHPSVPPVK